jgi:hypothetical protein
MPQSAKATMRRSAHFDINSHILEPSGTTMSFVIRQDIDEADYPSGTLVMYWEEEDYGGTRGSLAGPTGSTEVKFIGWQSTANIPLESGEAGIIGGVEIDCISVAGRLRELPGFPQIVERKSNPNKWTKLKDFNLDRYLWYLLHWHSTALELADYIPSGWDDTYVLKSLQSDGRSLYEQVNERCKAIAYNLTCDQRGRLAVTPDPMLLEYGNRTPDVIVALQSSDWTRMSIRKEHHPRTGWLTGAAIVASASKVLAVKCIAPGDAPGQGLNQDILNFQLVVDQTELNSRTGHDYARRNTPWPVFQMSLINTGDAGIEPALGEWITFSLDATINGRHWSFTNQRALPQRVTINHNTDGSGSKIKEVQIDLEIETIGTPAQTVTVPLISSLTPSFILPATTFPEPVPGVRTPRHH